MNNPVSAVRLLLAVCAVAFVVSGCTTAKPTETEAGAATAAAPAPSTDSSTVSDSTTTADTSASSESTSDSSSDTTAGSSGPASINRYIVQVGDHLWGISAQPQVYGDPYQWPLLYKRNRDDIYDADLIYPGQVLHIDRDASEHQIQQAIDHAKTRGAWSLGVVEKSDIGYLMLAL